MEVPEFLRRADGRAHDEHLKTLSLYGLVARQPDHVSAQQARLELAEYALAASNFDEAVSLAGMAIEHGAGQEAAHARYLLGRRWFLAEDYEQAMRELLQVTMAYPQYADWTARAQLLIAQCQQRMGDRAGAAGTLQDILGRYPSGEFGADAQRLLEEMR